MGPSDVEHGARVLLVEFDPERRRKLAQPLKKHGYVVTWVGGSGTALTRAKSEQFELTVVHAPGAGSDGADLLLQLRTANPEGELIVLIPQAAADDTTKVLKLGAFDCLRMPCDVERLLIAMQRACEYARLRRENLVLRNIVQRDSPGVEIVGESRAMVSLRKQVARFAGRDKAVLVEGERGTGRELVARALRAGSPRRMLPFVAVTLATVPPERLERELFGYEQGTPGGREADGEGLLGTMDGGTVFLDEVTELEVPLQVKLLRLIERGELHRALSTRVRHVDVRVIAGTSRVLEDEIRKGAFQRDLFYRLSVLRISVPPLRERLEDIPLLAKHVLKRLAGAKGPAKDISDEAVRLLEGYDWPGNVRELAHVVERALTVSAGPCITAEDIGFQFAALGAAPVSMPLDEVESRHVARVLAEARGNKSRAARLLGINRRKLYRLMERFGLDRGARTQATAPGKKVRA